jgi:hypothetical protein
MGPDGSDSIFSQTQGTPSMVSMLYAAGTSMDGSPKIPSLGAERRAAPGWVGFRSRTPPEVPPCPRGDAIFIACGAAKRHEKLSPENPLHGGVAAGATVIAQAAYVGPPQCHPQCPTPPDPERLGGSLVLPLPKFIEAQICWFESRVRSHLNAPKIWGPAARYQPEGGTTKTIREGYSLQSLRRAVLQCEACILYPFITAIGRNLATL